ncbi:N-acetyl-gamma-glutamyl-phosphate reductase [Pseudalkalibacillus sp. R45]|uniref:N-acetyl-gamma-glutamyl-phosphate reductase n=1 Tax=Pseudalkalibacillus sp. R45 TaxID=3457433 RepID=UPI003FCE92BF
MKAAIIGGTGYGAVELVRLLHNHPLVEISTIVSHSNSGKELQSIYPHLSDIIDTSFAEMDVAKVSEEVDLVFFGTPSGVSSELIPQFMEHGVKCIDLAGDFRLKSPDIYETWYKKTAPPSQYTDQAIYGLSEIYPDDVKNATLIANPGCYPTATLLALIPVLKEQLIEPQSIIIDAKSGLSGAGRSQSLTAHFSETNENFRAYKVAAHQHIPEIEQVLANESGVDLQVSFTPHLVPMTRGIMCTIYSKLTTGQTTEELIALYKSFYKDHPFVRIRPEGVIPATKEVYGSNYCNIGFTVDDRTGRVTIVSVIDNLVKGAAGQAIQNMNLMQGWDEQTGLTNVPIYP